MSDKLEVSIDSTSLGTSSCIRNFFWTTVGSIKDNKSEGGYKTLISPAAIYGVAIHKFVDVMYKTNGDGVEATKKMLEAFKLPKNPPSKTQQYLIDERHLHVSAWNLWNDKIETESSFEVLKLPIECYWCEGKVSDCKHCNGTGIVEGPATEITFKIKIYEDDRTIIYLCGTIDTVGKFQNGCFAIRDWKTTSSHKQEEFITNFELSRQLRIYTLAAKIMSNTNPDSILGKIGATNMGAFIDAIFIKPKANDNEYLRSDVFQFNDEDLNKFKQTLMDYIHEFALRCIGVSSGLELPKEGILNGTCSTPYGKCKFWNVCKNNDTVASLILKRDFTRKIYDPLSFNEAI